jgi:hypothetical protein
LALTTFQIYPSLSHSKTYNSACHRVAAATFSLIYGDRN